MKFKEKYGAIAEVVGLLWNIRKTFVIQSFFISLITAVLPFVAIFLSESIINGLSEQREFSTLLLTVVIYVFIMFALKIVCSYLQKLGTAHIEYIGNTFNMKMSERTLSMDYQLLESPMVNQIRTKIRNDNNWGSGFYSILWDLPRVFSSVLELIISFIVLFPLLISGVFDVYSIVLIVLFLAIIALNTILTMKYRKKFLKKLDEFSLFFGFTGYFLWNTQNYKLGKDIRIFNSQKIVKDYIDNEHKESVTQVKSMVSTELKEFGLGSFFSGLLQVISYIFVAVKSATGTLPIGSVLKYAATIYRFSQSISSVSSDVNTLLISSKRQQSTLEYMNIKDVLYKGTLPVEKRVFCDNPDYDYDVEFKNVSFKYPGTDIFVLKNLNLKLRIGKKLAVVGMNGSGKTTMIKLLCRLYDPTEGEITLNGVNIQKYDYDEYMSIFSVVFQDFKLFSFGLGQNLAGAVKYDKALAEKCLKEAGLGDRLKLMPKGLETCLYKDFEEDGVEISGGEAQKIALARALYKRAPFIILDEPTAALDPLAEFEIYSKFNEIVGDKTTVYISHRLSSCRFCDDIIVFDEGKIVQRGSHDELIEIEDGKYNELWYAQAQYYTEESA